MPKRKAIPLFESAQYPSDTQAKGYAKNYREKFLPGKDPRTAYQRKKHNDMVDVLVCWGVNDIFFVFAYPPGGVEISQPEDLLTVQDLEGWIYEYRPLQDVWNRLVKLSHDGSLIFWQTHRLFKSH